MFSYPISVLFHRLCLTVKKHELLPSVVFVKPISGCLLSLFLATAERDVSVARYRMISHPSDENPVVLRSTCQHTTTARNVPPPDLS